MKQDQYFEIVSGIQKVIAFCKDSRLSCDNLVFDPEFMYYHNTLKRILMVYMPLNNPHYIRDSIPECLAEIHKSARNIIITDGNLMSRYESYLERCTGPGRKKTASFSPDSVLQLLESKGADLTEQDGVEFISESSNGISLSGYRSGEENNGAAAGDDPSSGNTSGSGTGTDEVYLTGSSGIRYDIKKLPFSIGRNPSRDLVIDQATVSGKHAVITEENGHYSVKDYSTNGTFLNSEDNRITCSEINDGDKLFFDQYCYTFSLKKAPDEDRTTRTVIVMNRKAADRPGDEAQAESPASSERAMAYLRKTSDDSLIKIMDYPFTSSKVEGAVIYTLNSSGRKGLFIKNVSCRSLLFENMPIEAGTSEELFSGCSLQINDEKYMFIVEN